ncbi:hypothetical protein [Thalassoroseus pseudoceratinae]|uniref:hypothetical protein n=1 Tax=Thalassoroseus pseudoceratinae TaxID=2713176 RepID=UPI00141F3E98|nr:hypothetical protein [Thalassoroseus pseudoceratinae]
MSGSAHITDVEAIANFLVAIRRFQDESLTALAMLNQQVSRALEFFDHDLPSQWKQRVRQCYDDISEARVRLETRRNRTVGGQRPACIEEKQALDAAKRSLRDAEGKVETTRRWAINLHKESDEYRGRSGRCKYYLENDLQRTIVLLERTLASVEKYLDRPLNDANESESSPTNEGN